MQARVPPVASRLPSAPPLPHVENPPSDDGEKRNDADDDACGDAGSIACAAR